MAVFACLGISLGIVLVANGNCVGDSSCAGVPDNSVLLQLSSSARSAAVQKHAEAKAVQDKVKVQTAVANSKTAKVTTTASEAKAQQGGMDSSTPQKRLAREELWREAQAQLQELQHEVALAQGLDEGTSYAQDAIAVRMTVSTEPAPEPSAPSATQAAEHSLEHSFFDVVKSSAELIGVHSTEESKPKEQKGNEDTPKEQKGNEVSKLSEQKGKEASKPNEQKGKGKEGDQKQQREAQRDVVRANRKAAQDGKGALTRIAQEKRAKAKQEMAAQHQVAKEKREATFKSLREAKEAKAQLAVQRSDAKLLARKKVIAEKTRKVEEKRAAKAVKYEAQVEMNRRLKAEKALKEAQGKAT